MKKYSLIIVAALTWASCSQNSGKTEDVVHNEAMEEMDGKIAGVLDPVCKMAKDDTWTEFTVNGADTVWFCSPHCKETYEKSPEKYTAH